MSKINRILLALPFVIVGLGLMAFAANIPIQDDYDAILNYLNHPWPERFYHLANFHNEHRIIPTRLVSELVYRLLGHVDFRAIIWIGNLGWWLFSACFAWLFIRRGGLFRWGAVFATWMLVGFYDQENVFWAMTSIQNHWVIVFAFAACLAFARRSDARWFAAALAFAVAATFTSGGGMLVFPALALMALCDYVFSHDRPIDKRRMIGITVFALVAFCACTVCLHGMPHNDDPSLVFPSDPIQRIKGIIGFFFCFFGNLLPSAWPAFLAGICVVIWGLVVCWFTPRYRQTPLAIFAFLSFLVATILAATVFRGCDASCALAGRYRLISTAILVSLLYLTLYELPLRLQIKKRLLVAAIIGSLTLSSIYIARGTSYNASHRASLESGIARWPNSITGLDYPTNRLNQVHASTILHECVKNGVYAPVCVKP